jgi:hypothetical protein
VNPDETSVIPIRIVIILKGHMLAHVKMAFPATVVSVTMSTNAVMAHMYVMRTHIATTHTVTSIVPVWKVMLAMVLYVMTKTNAQSEITIALPMPTVTILMDHFHAHARTASVVMAVYAVTSMSVKATIAALNMLNVVILLARTHVAAVAGMKGMVTDVVTLTNVMTIPIDVTKRPHVPILLEPTNVNVIQVPKVMVSCALM